MTFLQTYGFILTTMFDPAYDEWWAVKVYPDGNPIKLDRFASEDEADDFIAQVKADHIEANGQFGVGA